MKKDVSTSNYIDFDFTPQIMFVKSQAAFKIKLKLTTGAFYFLYLDFVPKDTDSPIIQELLDYTYLSNSFLNRLPLKHPYYVPIPVSNNVQKKKLEL